jgi:hypothetical protein
MDKFYYIYAMENKKCLECQEPVKGRVDKKFCSDYCRNAHNNKINKDSKNLIRNINNRLRKNHKILSELNVSGKTKVEELNYMIKVSTFNFLHQSIKQKREIRIFIFMMKVIWL